MKVLRNIVSLALLAIVFVYGLLFSLYNHQQVTLDFVFFEAVDVSFSLWSALIIFAGVVLGLLIAAASNGLSAMKIRGLEKDLKNTQKKLDKLTP